MLVKNVRLRNKEGLYNILIKEDKIKSISQNIIDEKEEGEIVDGKGGLALPPFIEPHVHLDATLTAGQPRWNISGTLFEGIQC